MPGPKQEQVPAVARARPHGLCARRAAADAKVDVALRQRSRSLRALSGETGATGAYNRSVMRYTIEVHPGYIKAEMRSRETSEETREFVQAILAALRGHRIVRVLISIRESRPVFKVEDWGLSDAIEQVRGMGLRVAFISDSKELAMSQEYIALLGRQKGLDFRTFASEPEAVDWLVAPKA